MGKSLILVHQTTIVMSLILRLSFFSLLLINCSVFAQEWDYSITAGSSSNDYGNRMKLDHDGNVIVHGFATSGANFDGTIVSFTGNYVAKYDQSGNLQWIKQAGAAYSLTSINRQTCGGIEVDSSGNIYVVGNFNTSSFVGDTALIGNATNFNVFIAKIDPSGLVLWKKYVTGGSMSTSITLDNDNNILFCGYTNAVSVFDGVTITPYPGTNTADIIFAKYDNNGVFQWVRQCGGGGSYPERAFGIACDKDNNVFVCGHIRTHSDFGGLPLMSSYAPMYTNYNGFLTKYNAAGVAQWVQYCGYHPTSLATLPNGDVYAGGYMGGLNNGFDSLLVITPTSNSKMFVTKLKTDGTYIWANSNYGTGVSGVNDLAADNQGNCYITGHYTYDAYFETDTLTGNAGGIWYPYLFVVKYDSTGNEIWLDKVGGASPSMTWGFGIDALDSCQLVVGGSFASPPAVMHTDTLTTFGGYDMFYSYAWDTCNIPTTISQLKSVKDELKLFPNPTSSATTLQFNNHDEHLVCVYDMNGKQILSTKASDQLTLQTSNWNVGIYLIRVRSIRNNEEQRALLMKE